MTLDVRTGITVEPRRVAAAPSEPLTFGVRIVNNTRAVQPYGVRLLGLEGATVSAQPAEVVLRPGEVGEIVIQARLPGYFPAGVHTAAVEVRGADVHNPVEAMVEVQVDVQSVASASIDLPRSHLKGRFGARAPVVLHNEGARPVTFSLEGASPDRSRALRFRFRPSVVEVPPGSDTSAQLRLASRPRLVGTSIHHAFDVTAQGASGAITTSGTYRHRPIIPSLVFKIIGACILIMLALIGLRAAVRYWVYDSQGYGWEPLAAANTGGGGEVAPRVGHSAVWVEFPDPNRETGLVPRTIDSIARWFSGQGPNSEGMIVWGGEGGDGPLGDGAFYRANDGVWMSVSHEGAPTARAGHTAVWTGETMVIWGGRLEGPIFAEIDHGGEYNPYTRSWSSLPPSPIRPRTGHSMTWTGRKLVVFGGMDTDGTVRGDGAVLTPPPLDPAVHPGARPGDVETELAGGTWETLTGFPGVPRSHHSATWTGTHLVIFGGYDADGNTLSDAYAYAPATGTWEDITRNPAPSPRACHKALWNGKGQIIILGGSSDPSPDGNCAPALELPIDPESWLINVDVKDDGSQIITTWEWVEPDEQPIGHMGTSFSALYTANEVTIVQLVRVLDSLAATRYWPDDGSQNLPLPDQKRILITSYGFTAIWINGGIVVWGGVEEDGRLTNRGAILVLPDR